MGCVLRATLLRRGVLYGIGTVLQVYETLLTYMCLTHSPIPCFPFPFPFPFHFHYHYHFHYHPRSFFLVPRCCTQVQVNALVLEHVFATQGQVGTQVGGHFKRQLMAKAVKLLGGVEVLGNPAGLVRSLGTF